MTKKSVFAAGLIECWFVHVGVCNFAHIETIYIRLYTQKIKTVSSCPHYHYIPPPEKWQIITFKIKYQVWHPIQKF